MAATNIAQSCNTAKDAKEKSEDAAFLTLPQELLILIFECIAPSFQCIVVRCDDGCSHVPGRGLVGKVLSREESTWRKSCEGQKWEHGRLMRRVESRLQLSLVCRKLDNDFTGLFYSSNDFQIQGRDFYPMILFLERLRPATRQHLKSIVTRDRLWPKGVAIKDPNVVQSQVLRPYSQPKYYYEVSPFYQLRTTNVTLNKVCVKFDLSNRGTPVALEQMSCNADWLQPLLEMKQYGLISDLTIDFGVEPPNVKRTVRPLTDDNYQPSECWTAFLDTVSVLGIDVRAYKYNQKSATRLQRYPKDIEH